MEDLLLPVGIGALAGAVLGTGGAYFISAVPMPIGFIVGGGVGALFGLFLVFKG